jgi:hypothetical protein
VWVRCKKWAAVLSLTGRIALGCQRTLWTVHTESTNNTEIEAVGRGIGQKIARFGGGTCAFLSHPASASGRAWRFRATVHPVLAMVDCRHLLPTRRNTNITQGNSAANLI